MNNNYTFVMGTSPIVATAIHDGHETRHELANLFNLTEEERLREEDPFTARWVKEADNHLVVHHSRFETDVNRPRAKAVYLTPEDAWGLKVWKHELSPAIANASLAVYDQFYKEAKRYFDSLFELHDKIVVYDIHSYNHRREGENIAADPADNPEINIGTKNMDKETWQPLVQKMIANFKTFDYNGCNLDVRENIKFKGGYFGQWLFQQYGKKICPVSIEFKKKFMDEWTGEPYEKDLVLINQLINSSKQTVLDTLKKMNT